VPPVPNRARPGRRSACGRSHSVTRSHRSPLARHRFDDRQRRRLAVLFKDRDRQFTSVHVAFEHTLRSYEKAASSAPHVRRRACELIPSAEPWLAGSRTAETQARRDRRHRLRDAEALNAVSRRRRSRGSGSPRPHRMLGQHLVRGRMQADTREPVYGIPSASSSSCTFPSSPPRPCSAKNAASGSAAERRDTRSMSTSIGSNLVAEPAQRLLNARP